MQASHMSTANKKAKFQNRSEAFKEVHKAAKGIMVINGQLIHTNKQKAILHGVQDNGRSEENVTVESVEELNLDFGV